MKIAVLMLLLSCLAGLPGSDEHMEAWSSLAGTAASKNLAAWFADEAARCLSGSGAGRDLPVELPSFYGRLGLFITVLKNGTVRGCYGSFYHDSGDAAVILRSYLQGALRHDVRHEPLGIEELDGARIILTVTTQPFTVEELERVDIARYGVIIHTQDGEQHVFVPAEMKTHRHLRKKLGGMKIQAVQAFRAVTLP